MRPRGARARGYTRAPAGRVRGIPATDMLRVLSQAALFALLAAGAAQASCGGEPGGPAVPRGRQGPPGAAAPAPPAAPAERDAGERADLARALAGMQSWPLLDAWYGRLESLLDPPDLRWVATRDGYLPGRALAFELAWNRPAQGRELPRFLDYADEPHPYSTIVDLARQLEEHGIALVVVPVPTRLQIYPELAFEESPALPEDFAGLSVGTAQWSLALGEAGVQVVDLLLPFAAARDVPAPEGHSRELYLKYNMHWTPRAARLAARLAAQRVRGLWDEAPGPLAEGRDFVRRDWDGRWVPEGGRQQPDDTVPEAFVFEQVVAPDGSTFESRDPASPVLLLSDSYGTHFSVEHASFAEHLAAELGRGLDVIAVKGGGVGATRRALERREAPFAEKRVLVWLFSVVSLADQRDWVEIDFFE